MIRSTRLSLKFANRGKREQLRAFLLEYRRVIGLFVDILWEREKVTALLPRQDTDSVESWLSARARQAAAKQASAIVRGCRKKQRARVWMIGKLRSEGRIAEAERLQRYHDRVTVSKPSLDTIEAELDSRFISVSWNAGTSFDGWLTIGSMGRGIKLRLPVKRTKHFNKLASRGTPHTGARLSIRSASICFDLPDPEPVTEGKTLGIDIGLIDAITCSDGQVIGSDPHGHTYQTICQKLARKRKGGKGFERACRHRSNFLGWVANQLNLEGVSVVQRENIRNLRKWKRNARTMQAWNYRELFSKIDNAASEHGVRIKKLRPAYTSQRCSACGWTWKGNRKGKLFRCSKCGHATDADLNAALNLSFDLPELSPEVHRRHPSRTGFYWGSAGREPIVPAVQQAVP